MRMKTILVFAGDVPENLHMAVELSRAVGFQRAIVYNPALLILDFSSCWKSAILLAVAAIIVYFQD